MPRNEPTRRRDGEGSRLRARLAEAEQTLAAIRDGAVDALVVSTPEGERVYALQTADRSYRHIIESVHEGAATLTADGTVFYANRYLAELLGAPLERVIGSSFRAWLEEPDPFDAWLHRVPDAGSHQEGRLRGTDGRSVPVYLALSRLLAEEGPGLALVVTDLRAQKQNEALLASEELSRSILEQAADAVVVCDVRGIVVRASAAAKRLGSDGPLQRPFEDVFGFALPDGPVQAVELELPCGAAEPATLLMSARPLRGPEGPLGTVVTLTDISERKRTEDALRRMSRAEREAREVAEAASRAKDEFLAMLAHELRNPLFALRNAVEVAASGMRDSRPLDIAARQVTKLTRLVDDLLDVARMQRGQVELRRETVDVAGWVGRAVETVRSALDARGHRLDVWVEAGLEIDGDPHRLEQLLANVLSNAVKYTEPGGHVAVDASRDGDEIVVRVRDDGAGIETELLSRVFDLFSQGRRAPDRSAGGLGIGLTVTKQLVELHGGRVEARSDGPGQGAEISIRLPLIARATRGEPAPVLVPTPASENVDVLVVEDNADAAESLAMLLTMLGHRVRTVPDAHAALDAVRKEPPDVALVDIGLPGMDGYELACRLRELDLASNTFLVALTGYGLAQDKQRSAEAGFHTHIVKPVDVDQLKRLLKRPPSAERA